MENNKKVEFSCIELEQPIGRFYIGSLPSKTLCEITYSDVRRISGERSFESYLGIQRPLNRKRVEEIRKYVDSPDACFPTAVILAVPQTCATYDPERFKMEITEGEDSEGNKIPFNQIAKVIDGQHRIEGLRGYDSDDFEVNVSIFIDLDTSDQAYLFSTVNLAQTKVNKSLVYDLFELAKTRSPQKSAHNIAVALDRHDKSPFYRRIKRLGVATPGRKGETLTQATVVQALLELISPDPMADRNAYLEGREPDPLGKKEREKYIFRHMFLDGRDFEITDVLWNYFEAVSSRWPDAWNDREKGWVLNRTNGFRALMRFLRDAYLYLIKSSAEEVPSINDFSAVLERVQMTDDEFTTENFKPGTSGESALYRRLQDEAKISGQSDLFDRKSGD